MILDSLAEAVTIRARDNHLIYANRAALDRMRLRLVAALREADPQALMGPYETTGELGHELALDDLPSVRCCAARSPSRC